MVNISKANAEESKDEIELKSEEEPTTFFTQEDSNEVVKNNQKSPTLSLKGMDIEMVNISKANAEESKDEIELKSEEEPTTFFTQEDSNEVVKNNQKSPTLSLKGM